MQASARTMTRRQRGRWKRRCNDPTRSARARPAAAATTMASNGEPCEIWRLHIDPTASLSMASTKLATKSRISSDARRFLDDIRGIIHNGTSQPQVHQLVADMREWCKRDTTTARHDNDVTTRRRRDMTTRGGATRRG